MSHPAVDRPRFQLLDGPSPLAPLPRLSAALGGRAEVWIKREDLLPLAFGGNKLRNLEFLVGAAIAEGADSLVTAGRRWSNHGRLTAAAGAVAGLDVHLVLSGPPADPPNPGVRLDVLLGAVVHQARTADRAERDALVAQVIADLRAAGRHPYLIPVGGGGSIGAHGQLLAAEELLGQAAARGIGVDAIVLPSATGVTQVGLLAGLRAGGSPASVVGVAVAHPPDELRPTIADLLAELGTMTGIPVDPAQIELDGAELGPGYGRPTGAADEATRLLARTEGILVDPIYTAKALAGLVRRVREGRADGRTVVFWHAGGLPGLFEPPESPSPDGPPPGGPSPG
ncbi:MAG: pyridoxal-phosphate dependent enzyme [Chloroflexota bacterium]|nr:pyridoxal-phosphate dependent enzyme [Chloroflexota bacterium]